MAVALLPIASRAMSGFLILLLLADRSALEVQPRGWVDLFAGPGAVTWTRVEPVSTAGVVSKIHRDVPVWRFKRDQGLLEVRGDLPPGGAPGGKDGTHEMLRYDKELGDFILHVEWRFVDPARPGWNAGVYARVNRDATVWHQAQLGARDVYWFGDTPDEQGKIVRRKAPSHDVKLNPPGQWNSYELQARGGKLLLWLNGALISEMEVRVRRGYIGFESEYHHVQFRNVKLKEL
jgi:hypothetical protein